MFTVVFYVYVLCYVSERTMSWEHDIQLLVQLLNMLSPYIVAIYRFMNTSWRY